MAIGLLRDGEVVTAATGVGEVGGDAPVSPDDVFRIASLTKPFVATLVLSLAQDELLDLDEPPAATSTEATIRQLLSHQGGLACERPELLDGLRPGELFSYSNAGFWLVGAAIAHAAGMTFEDAMRSRVLDPLGLAATGFEATDGVPGHYQAAPGSAEHRPADPEYPQARWPSGGLWSTVDDLLRFATHHLGGPGPLTPGSIDELQRPASAPPGVRHGLGWFLTERAGRPCVEHAGSVGGYQSLLMLVPGEQLAFAALTNSARGKTAIRDVLDLLGLSYSPRPEVSLEPDVLEALAGRYEAPGLRTLVEPAGRHLRLTSSERNPLTREITRFPPMVGRPVGRREFEVVDGEWRGEIFGFPRDGLLSLGVLSQRVS